jgi:hypothetical protein
MQDCLTNLVVTDAAEAATMVACLREFPDDPTSSFRPDRSGIYASAATLPWFDYLFHLAGGADGDTLYSDFVDRVAMPRGSHPPFDQGQFDIVAEWVARGMPLLDDYINEGTGGSCTPSITPALTAHVNAMATEGWTAVNKSNGIQMFGCAGAADVRDCLQAYPRASSTAVGEKWETALPGSVTRILRTNTYSSDYWTRSSADGRFVANGGDQSGLSNTDSTIVDLERDIEIPTSAFYDPGFFPDNSGFAFQGSQPRYCNQSILTVEPAPAQILYSNNPDCLSAGSVGLYQHIGRALNGGDYFSVFGQFNSDDPPGTGQGDSPADFTTSQVGLVPMVHTGATYEAKAAVGVDLSDDEEMGDTAISPSSRMLVSRVYLGTGGAQNGYRVHLLTFTPNGGTYDVDAAVAGTICVTGSKPGFSYDERFMAIHHFATAEDAVDLGFSGPSDPAFQPYIDNVSNIYVVDMLTGEKTRVTNMQPSQWALYPHFRSDGWMYFMVQMAGHSPEYIVASDAALVIAGF